jgi:hypothetical protein
VNITNIRAMKVTNRADAERAAQQGVALGIARSRSEIDGMVIEFQTKYGISCYVHVMRDGFAAYKKWD